MRLRRAEALIVVPFSRRAGEGARSADEGVSAASFREIVPGPGALIRPTATFSRAAGEGDNDRRPAL
jgi:hypothetical protein